MVSIAQLRNHTFRQQDHQKEMNDQSNSEYGRPRRPNPDTVAYLNGLPLDENVAAEQARNYVAYFQKQKTDVNDDDGEPPEYPPMLSATHAALSSIFHELASLACEEIPSQQIETLVRIACRFSLIAKRIVMAGMSSYWVFLSTHRFGSHVAQTVLRCAVAECEVNLDEFDDGNAQSEGKMIIEDSYENTLQNETVPSLSKLLVQAMEELKPFASELAVHVCGSHVLRSALCIMAGVDFVDAFPHPGSNRESGACGEWDTGVLAATRRGKLKDKKKKKKKRGNPNDEEKGSSPQVVTVTKDMKVVDELQSDDIKKETDALLNEMVGILSLSDGKEAGKVHPPGELQHQTCHPSAGPLLVQILRLLSCRNSHLTQSSKKKGGGKEAVVADRQLGILPLEPRYSHGSQAESFVFRLLCWDPSSEGDNDDSGEATIAKQPYAGDIIFGLSGEPRGSILLEAILRCCPDSFHDSLCSVGGFYDEATLREYIQHGVSNYVVQALLNSVRNREQASRMVKCLCGIVEDGSILKGKAIQSGNSRMGIIWRAFELVANKGSSQDQEQILSSLLRGFASTIISPDEDDSEHNCKSEDKKRKKRSKAKALSAEECIPHLLGLTPGSCEGKGESRDRLTLDATGARALYHVFHFKERLRKEWITGIVNIYGREDLVRIANDGLGSRCIMDGLLDGPERSIASKLLYPKLSEHITFLSTERVGRHTVEKLFLALPTMEDKAALSAQLSHSLSRLGSNAMGRSVMASCAVKEYLEGESSWKEAVARQREKENWLDEILGEQKEAGSGDESEDRLNKRRKKEKKQRKKS